MAIWKDPTPAAKANEPSRFDLASPAPTPSPAPAPEPFAAPAAPAPVRAVDSAAARESVIAADLTIEGKIEGTGHVRIAGRFNGDVNVQGNLTIETGARLSGGVRAHKVIVAGELEGNIESAQRVELLESGALTGDVKAGVLTVASGARMRGQVDFGWSDKDAPAGRGDKGRSGTKPDADA